MVPLRQENQEQPDNIPREDSETADDDGWRNHTGQHGNLRHSKLSNSIKAFTMYYLGKGSFIPENFLS